MVAHRQDRDDVQSIKRVSRGCIILTTTQGKSRNIKPSRIAFGEGYGNVTHRYTTTYYTYNTTKRHAPEFGLIGDEMFFCVLSTCYCGKN
ncbi:hypothetical protein V1478_003409, partial [Vespula squamosa]